jgi:hypothetical protein
MSTRYSAPALTRDRPNTAVAATAAAAIGIVVGIVTSFAQAQLHTPWAALANSASPWLLGGFAAGALQTRRIAAVVAGLGTCVLEVVGYYVTAAARGYPVNRGEIVFWVVSAVFGGPLFGWAGWTWWRAADRFRPWGAGLAPATFLAEAIGTYELRLHYQSTVVLYVAIGLVLLAVVTLPSRAESKRPLAVITSTAAATLVGIIIYWQLLDVVAGAHFTS